MSKLTIVAHITARPDTVDLVKTALEQLVEPTRAEAGCLRYDLHRDDEDPVHFMFYETWGSRELWQAHMGSRHIADYRAATDGAVEDFRLYEMTHLA